MESLSRLFDVFGRERRRYALYALAEADEPVELEELAAQITRWEEDDGGPSTEAFEDVVLSLRHTHLPKAAQAEYVEYDRERGEIRISGEPPEFQIILTVSEAFEHPEPGRRFDPEELTPEEFLAKLAPSVRSSD